MVASFNMVSTRRQTALVVAALIFLNGNAQAYASGAMLSMVKASIALLSGSGSGSSGSGSSGSGSGSSGSGSSGSGSGSSGSGSSGSSGSGSSGSGSSGSGSSGSGSSGSGSSGSGSSGSSLPGTVYYVRTNGSDTNDGLSPSNAFRTLAKAATVAGPNRTIVVGAGSYQHTTYMYLNTTAGSLTTPCTWLADRTGTYTGDAGDVIVRTPSTDTRQWIFYVDGVSGYIFDGFKFQEATNVTYAPRFASGSWDSYNWPYALTVRSSSNITIRNCTFSGMIYQLHIESSSNVTASACTFSDTRYMSVICGSSTGVTVSGSSFSHPNSINTASGNYVYGVYASNTGLTVSSCTFDETANYARDEYVSGAFNQNGYLYVRGVSTDSSAYSASWTGPNVATTTVSNCTFTKLTDLPVYTAWQRQVAVSGNTMTNCRYGVYSHAEEATVSGNTISLPLDTKWKMIWSYGVYLCAYSAPTNKNAPAAFATAGVTPSATCSNNTIERYQYGVMVGSDNCTLSNLTLTGDTRWTDASRSAWVNYTYGITATNYCRTLNVNGSNGITMTNQYIAISNNGADNINVSNLTLADQYHGVYGGDGNYNLQNCTFQRTDYNAVSIWGGQSLTAENCSFSNTNRSWAVTFTGKKIPRTPSGTPGWDYYQEVDLYGTYGTSAATIKNCTFTNNAYGVSLGYLNNTLTAANNTLTGTTTTAVQLVDGNYTLANNAEFTITNSPNATGIYTYGPGGSADMVLGKLTITGYNISGCRNGLSAANTEVVATNCRFFNNSYIGLYNWRGKMTATNVECDLNAYGMYVDGNQSLTIDGANCHDNTQYGLNTYVFSKWRGVAQTPVYDVRNVTANGNTYGMVAAAYDVDAAGAWSGGNFEFPLRNLTCSNNSYTGLSISYGYLRPDNNLAIVCNNNGGYDSNGYGRWAFGMYVYHPQRNITFNGSSGITVSGNSWAGIGIEPRNYAPVDVTLTGATLGVNHETSLYAAECRNITVSGSTTGGIYARNPQGTVDLRTSTFSGGNRGVMVYWGDYEDAGWQAAQAAAGVTLRAPTSITLADCNLTNNRGSGAYIGWWYNWNVLTSDKRAPLTITNCTATGNGSRGMEIWNNNLTASGLTVSNNSVGGATVWNGSTTLSNSTFHRNTYGRDANNNKTGWTACELVHWYDDTRRWTYDVQDCQFTENEGHGLYVYNYGGTATLRNLTANDSYYDGVHVERCSTTATNITSLRSRQSGQAYIYGNAVITDCVANNNGSWGFYGHGSYGNAVNASGATEWVATGDHTITATNLTANDNTNGGILAWCMKGTINGSQAHRNYIGIQAGYDDLANTYTTTISNCSMNNNGWVGLYGSDSRLVLQNVVCSANAGGFHNNGTAGSPTQVTATDCQFNGNRWYGVSFSNSGSTLTRVQCNNSTEGNGAYIGGAATRNCTVTESQFLGNPGQGLNVSDLRDVVVDRNQIRQNGGWALFLYQNHSAVMRNNLVVNNAYGCYVRDTGVGAQVLNNTVANNTNAYGVFIESGIAEVRNNIIANNNSYGLYSGSSSLTASNNLVYGHNWNSDYWTSSGQAAPFGSNNVSKPPRFVDPTTFDYHLAKGSPAINAGYTLTSLVDYDFEANARPMYRAYEIGAYEYTNPSGSVRVVDWGEQR